MTPIDEVMRALDDLVSQGKVHYIGVSDTPAWVVARANTMAELRGWSRFVGLQLRYSLIDRTVERELLPMSRALDLAVTPWSVLGAGVLTGKYNQPGGKGRAQASAGQDERNLMIAKEVSEIAEEIGCTPSQVAISWTCQQPGVVIPLIGATNVTQLRDNLGSLDVLLAKEHLDRLDKVSAKNLGFPTEFLRSEGVRDLVYGGTFDRIDDHRSGRE
jgi:aryl-alcohol dehydrogenase-like predicted oxidoreductase